MRKFLIGVIVICIVTASYSLYSLFKIYEEYNASSDVYKKVETIYKQPIKQSEKINQLETINDDYVGWIKIDNTKIDYPIVLTEDNDYYLNHNFYQEEDFAGAIFMDYRHSREQLNRHTIIYGHNMKDNSMFGSLKKYADQKYFENYRFIELEFLDDVYLWEVFSTYITNDINWMMTEFNKNDYTTFLNRMEQDSMISSEVDLTSDDTILTLATCTVNSTEMERYIVHAKLIEKMSD